MICWLQWEARPCLRWARARYTRTSHTVSSRADPLQAPLASHVLNSHLLSSPLPGSTPAAPHTSSGLSPAWIFKQTVASIQDPILHHVGNAHKPLSPQPRHPSLACLHEVPRGRITPFLPSHRTYCCAVIALLFTFRIEGEFLECRNHIYRNDFDYNS